MLSASLHHASVMIARMVFGGVELSGTPRCAKVWKRCALTGTKRVFCELDCTLSFLATRVSPYDPSTTGSETGDSTVNAQRIINSIAAVALLGIVVALAIGGPDARPAKNAMRVVTGENAVSVYSGDSELMRYRYRGVPFKPYVRQIVTPKGVSVLRDAPHDHLHHHALMFAAAVDGVDFWSEGKANGRQVHRSFTNAPDNRGNSKKKEPRTGFTELLDWVAPKGQEVLLTERRTIQMHMKGDDDASILTWRSRMALRSGKKTARLTGSHYFGLGMRFVTSMDKGGRFDNASGKEGKVVRGTEKLTPATWCAYFAKADGKAVTVAMFDHPSNPRHPAAWFTMTKPFAYLAATLNLSKEPLTLTADKPLTLQYGVALWDGHVQRDRIEKAYKKWSTSPVGTAVIDKK